MNESTSQFLDWLRSDAWHLDQLLDWCAFGSGRGRNEIVPADFIRSSLSSAPDSAILRGRLAHRIAQALAQQPDLKFNYLSAESAAEQMLVVCTFLERADLLSDAVWKVFQGIHNSATPFHSGLFAAGAYLLRCSCWK